jgi:cell division inhibitor SepF
MGIFDWVMKGVDIKEDDTIKTENKDDVYSSYDESLQKLQSLEKEETRTISKPNNEEALSMLGLSKTKQVFSEENQSAPILQRPKLTVFKIGSHKDLQLAINSLKSNFACIIDFQDVKHRDRDKMMDFLSGAVFALKGSMHRIKGQTFIISTEGTQIELQEQLKENK